MVNSTDEIQYRSPNVRGDYSESGMPFHDAAKNQFHYGKRILTRPADHGFHSQVCVAARIFHAAGMNEHEGFGLGQLCVQLLENRIVERNSYVCGRDDPCETWKLRYPVKFVDTGGNIRQW